MTAAVALALVAPSGPVAPCCVVCGHGFSDPHSEALGIGPDCRKRHGYGARQALPNWPAVDAALAGTAAAADVAAALCDARAAGAAIVLRFAVEGRHCASAPAYISALAALGFVQLATRLAKQQRPIAVTTEGEGPGAMLVVRAPYNAAFADALRAAGVRSTWDGAARVRRVPAAARRALWAALVASYPAGTLVAGPKGVRVLGQPAAEGSAGAA